MPVSLTHIGLLGVWFAALIDDAAILLLKLWQGVFHNQELYFTKLIGETKILPSRAEKDSDITIDLMLDSDEHGLVPMGTYACKGAVSQGAAVQLVS